jgi:hypothetical protein
MAKGKAKCRALKEIRRRIAEANDVDISLVTSECSHKGDCKGTCPKCESELRRLEEELAKRKKGVVIGGICAGATLAGIIAVAEICPESTRTACNEVEDYIHATTGKSVDFNGDGSGCNTEYEDVNDGDWVGGLDTSGFEDDFTGAASVECYDGSD